MCSSCAIISSLPTVQSMHAGIQHPRVLYMASHTIDSVKSHFCNPQVMCRHAVTKVRLLFKDGFYSRATFIQDFTVYFKRVSSLLDSGA